jgi:DNA-binding response OmpR family regulator
MTMRVLVVEDDRELADSVSDALRLRGHHVIVALTGQAACEVISDFRPDAALVDVRLPDIDGVTLVGLLRGYLAEQPLRVVGFSSPEKSLEAAGRRHLFDTWVSKPSDIETIERALVATD